MIVCGWDRNMSCLQDHRKKWYAQALYPVCPMKNPRMGKTELMKDCSVTRSYESQVFSMKGCRVPPGSFLKFAQVHDPNVGEQMI